MVKIANGGDARDESEKSRWRFGSRIRWAVCATTFILSGCATDGNHDRVTAEAEPETTASVAESDAFLGTRYGQNLTESDRVNQADATAAAVTGGDGSAAVPTSSPGRGGER
jgi:hypothetical protein